MSVDQLFEDVKYGVTKLKEYHSRFDFYHRGTLASLRAIPDYLLEEYNQKFALGIKLDEDLTKSWLDKAEDNPKAKEFYAFYKAERKILLEDEIGKRLMGHGGERNLIMHRKVSPKKHTATVKFVSDPSTPPGILGPMMGGYAFDATGSYYPAFMQATALCVGAQRAIGGIPLSKRL